MIVSVRVHVFDGLLLLLLLRVELRAHVHDGREELGADLRQHTSLGDENKKNTVNSPLTARTVVSIATDITSTNRNSPQKVALLNISLATPAKL